MCIHTYIRTYPFPLYRFPFPLLPFSPLLSPCPFLLLSSALCLLSLSPSSPCFLQTTTGLTPMVGAPVMQLKCTVTSLMVWLAPASSQQRGRQRERTGQETPSGLAHSREDLRYSHWNSKILATVCVDMFETFEAVCFSGNPLYWRATLSFGWQKKASFGRKSMLPFQLYRRLRRWKCGRNRILFRRVFRAHHRVWRTIALSFR